MISDAILALVRDGTIETYRVSDCECGFCFHNPDDYQDHIQNHCHLMESMREKGQVKRIFEIELTLGGRTEVAAIGETYNRKFTIYTCQGCQASFYCKKDLKAHFQRKGLENIKFPPNFTPKSLKRPQDPEDRPAKKPRLSTSNNNN